MKEPSINKKIFSVMFGFLFIGGIAAILGIAGAAKKNGHQPGNVFEERDEDVLVYGAHV